MTESAHQGLLEVALGDSPGQPEEVEHIRSNRFLRELSAICVPHADRLVTHPFMSRERAFDHYQLAEHHEELQRLRGQEWPAGLAVRVADAACHTNRWMPRTGPSRCGR